MKYIVIGQYESLTPELAAQADDAERWHECMRPGPHMAESAENMQGQEGAWCVVVDGVTADTLEADSAVLAYARYRP